MWAVNKCSLFCYPVFFSWSPQYSTFLKKLIITLGLFQNLSSGGWATFFFRPLHPQDTHGVRAPRPPGLWIQYALTPRTSYPPAPTPRTHCQQNTLPPPDKKVSAPPRIISGTALTWVGLMIWSWFTLAQFLFRDFPMKGRWFFHKISKLENSFMHKISNTDSNLRHIPLPPFSLIFST